MNKEKQYTEIYFPENMIDLKEKAYWALLDIDSNFSRIIQDMLPQILRTAKAIDEEGKNRRHFDWGIVIREKGKRKIRRFINEEEKEKGKKTS